MERTRQSTVALFALSILAFGRAAVGAAPLAGASPGHVGAAVAAEPDGVRLRGRWFEDPVRRAVTAAIRGLGSPACASVLSDFRDGAGRDLGSRLDALGLDAPGYARLVLFYDGSSDAPCRRPHVYAFTSPGSRVVRACPALGALAGSQPGEAAAVVIHELLHSLGLEHDAPSSGDITARVERRCAAVVAAQASFSP